MTDPSYRSVPILASALLLALIPAEISAQARRTAKAMGTGELLALLNSDQNPLRRAPSKFVDGNYLGPVLFLEQVDERFTKIPAFMDFRDQTLAAYLANVGDYDRANALVRGTSPGIVRRLDDQATASFSADYQPRAARDAIVAAADGRRVVMLNEAHHVPQTRMLTLGLLEPLRRAGFTHLALEAISPEQIDAIVGAGRPVLGRGGYLDEPVFADVLRRAHALGFEFVSYEPDVDTAFDPSDPMRRMREREEGQARQLAEVLAADPAARILVHCGYAHLMESGGRYPSMAQCLAKQAEIDPLTVEQTLLRSGPSEDAYYRAAAGHRQQEPFVLERDAEFWQHPAHRGRADLSVFLPRPRDLDGRPDWLQWYGARRPVRVARATVDVETVPAGLLQAFRVDEFAPDAVPVDQIRIDGTENAWQLCLPPGDYQLQLRSQTGEALPAKRLRVADVASGASAGSTPR